MAKTETIRARVAPDVKEEAEAVLDTLGLSATEAITLFYRQIALQHGLPFDVRVPNAETRAALDEARDKGKRTRYDSLDALRDEFE